MEILTPVKKINLYIVSILSGFCLLSCSDGNNVELIQNENQIDIMVDSRLITSYLYGSHLSKPVLYPLLSPSGEIVTRSYPFNIVKGESTDHPHQAGVFFTYGTRGEAGGSSFWANSHDIPPLNSEAKLPRINHEKIIKIGGGRNTGTLETMNLWVDSENKPIIKENRLMEFQVLDDEYRIDFTITLTPFETAIKFTDTKEGMFAIRVADWLAESANGSLYPSTGEYMNAEGETTERNVWGKRSSWMRLEGEKDGRRIGIVIFNHPLSVNYPTYWHARGYGCFTANPLGQFEFQQGRRLENPSHFSLELDPGDTALFKFRMSVYEGARNREQLSREFAGYSDQ
jgi:hypothetical protein